VPGTPASTDQQQDPNEPGPDGLDPIGSPETVALDTLADARPERASRDPLTRLESIEPAPGGRRRRPVDRTLLLASFGISIGLVLVVLGLLRSVTGREQVGLPEAIESIDPVRDATQVPQQTRVFVDLQIGYEAIMFIDGVELPVVSLDDVAKLPPAVSGGGDQVEIPPGAIWEPGNATLTFEPGPSQVVESFGTGAHTVTIRYWRTEDGPDRSRTFTWQFYAV
jgi:hypothetical protein